MELKFVSYSGKYPNLCSGILVIEIDGKTVSFGGDPLDESKKTDWPKFWSSGGHLQFSDDSAIDIVKEPWDLECARRKDYSSDIWLLMPKLIEVMNENVPYGCCGGCV